MEKNIRDVHSALDSASELGLRLKGKRVVVFLDYDGTLTPIVARPELAVLSQKMRATVNSLAERCTVAIISGRDRLDVQKLVSLENLFFAGSHGFDIAGPGGKSIQHEMGGDWADILTEVRTRLAKDLENIEGLLIEPKKFSIAVHYRLVTDDQAKQKIKRVIDQVLADHPKLRMTPGKMVWDIQPRIDWDKGKAVLWLLKALHLDSPEFVPIYLGDDVTDEDAFKALEGRGIGIFVGHASGEGGERATAADYMLRDPDEVGTFLETLPPS